MHFIYYFKTFAAAIDGGNKTKKQCQQQIKQGAMLPNSEITYIIGAPFVFVVAILRRYSCRIRN